MGYGIKAYKIHFSSLRDSSLLEFLRRQCYDIRIQGSTVALKYDLAWKFLLPFLFVPPTTAAEWSLIWSLKYGTLNFRPGDLPKYRGCSAAE